jgi:cytoskeleton protein RodZ
VSLFQRITTPFGGPEADASDRMRMHNAAGHNAGGYNAAGELLLERRRQLQLDLDAVAEALCIKPAYLAAIEQGRTEELPGSTYALGFIRAYANYLGLDGERVLDSYREEKTEIQTRPDLTLPMPLGERGVPGGRVLLIGLVLALCGYGAWYYVGTGQRERPERVAAVPAELQILTAPASSVQAAAPAPNMETAAPAVLPVRPGPAGASLPPGVTATQFSSGLRSPQQSAAGAVASSGAPSSPEPSGAVAHSPTSSAAESAGDAASASSSQPETAAAGPSAPPSGSIDIKELADSWIQIRDGDQDAGQGIVFARVLKAGETYRVPRSGLILRTGNAGALEVLVDGKPAPALGALGTLRRNVTLEPDALRAGTAVRG